VVGGVLERPDLHCKHCDHNRVDIAQCGHSDREHCVGPVWAIGPNLQKTLISLSYLLLEHFNSRRSIPRSPRTFGIL